MELHRFELDKRGGKREMGWIQPVCSCGWTGNKEYAYNDYQHSNARDQKRKHLDCMKALTVQKGNEDG